MALKFIQTFQVTGGGEFPHDMLRHDTCFPVNEAETALMGSDHLEADRTINLARHTHHKDDFPTVDRWKTFGWVVDEDRIEVNKIPKDE